MTARALSIVAVALALTACSGAPTTGDGGTDAGKPNPCANKPNYVFDASFNLEACGAYVGVEGSAESDAARAAQFITPLAGVKLPVSKPYKFSWSTASFPNAPMPEGGADSDAGGGAGLSGVAYVVYFVDANTSKELLRVHTTATEWTPDDAAWGKLTAAAKMPNPPGLQLKIAAALFSNGAIASGTVPVIAPQPRLVYLDPMM